MQVRTREWVSVGTGKKGDRNQGGSYFWDSQRRYELRKRVLREEFLVERAEVGYQRQPRIIIKFSTESSRSPNKTTHLQLPLYKVEASDHFRDWVFDL